MILSLILHNTMLTVISCNPLGLIGKMGLLLKIRVLAFAYLNVWPHQSTSAYISAGVTHLCSSS